MCGISGIVDLRATREIQQPLLREMNDRQIHRGPDGSGYHFESGVGLGHRRLSIIDLEGGVQPMYNEDQSVVLTYNGEIYDFSQKAEELRQAGHIFKTRCDTETVVHAWEEWGESCVDRLQGMFAFGIWDRNQRTAFLARDRFGKKPLYYTVTSSGFLVFGSELKVVLAHPDVERTIDPTAVEDYMTLGYVPDPKTIFRNIYKLPPAHSLLFQHGDESGRLREYWRPLFDVDENRASGAEVEEELLRRLRAATEKRMIADVPLGAFLSGGVDSSAVVSMMSSISDEPVNTCSISFGDPAFNESRYAQEVADRLSTAHRVEQVEPGDFHLVDRIPEIYDEPFADSSALPTFRVCELARKHVTVALSGDGGDEVFAGYRRYRWHMNEERVRSRLPGWLRKGVFGVGGTIYPKLDWAPRFLRAKSTLQAIARDSLEAYLYSVSILSNDVHGQLFSESFRRELQGYSAREVFEAHASQCSSDDPLSRIQYVDMKTYLPGDILTKVDRASMANSLEVRAPLLDTQLTEWVGTLPSNMKLRNGVGKYVFKKALERMVSDSILYREKMGFAVPLASWFRGPLRETVKERLLGTAMREAGIFDLKFVESLLAQHFSGRRDHSPPIWALLVFEGFYRSLLR